MIYDFLLINRNTGITLFHKKVVGFIERPSLVGNLLTAVTKQSIPMVGLPLTYFELSNIAISLSQSTKLPVLCVVFHDVEDGSLFGRSVAHELLNMFLRRCNRLPSKITREHKAAITADMPRALKAAMVGVVTQLQQSRSVRTCFLTGSPFEESSLFAGDMGGDALGSAVLLPRAQTRGTMTGEPAVFSLCGQLGDMLGRAHDALDSSCLEGIARPADVRLEFPTSRLYVRAVRDVYLVVHIRKRKDADDDLRRRRMETRIQRSCEQLSKLLDAYTNLQVCTF
eukprot:gnl/Dysnectes_brevis/4858_a6732_474.p1 GENE.gnl/Dysnectes_brevis/4858_a6732_474~~gnl/Dysnectes_brevis/4858_a6732_474.p1  ORF type:complete len:283 (+),score=49.92 gnl/Dysnectes_brevis/4858_a6732_474:91-939(+)